MIEPGAPSLQQPPSTSDADPPAHGAAAATARAGGRSAPRPTGAAGGAIRRTICSPIRSDGSRRSRPGRRCRLSASGSSATRSLANSPAAVSAQASARSLHSVRCSAVREGSLLARAASTTMRRSASCAASRTLESSRAPASVSSGMVVLPSVHSLDVASDCRSRAARWLTATTACRRAAWQGT